MINLLRNIKSQIATDSEIVRRNSTILTKCIPCLFAISWTASKEQHWFWLLLGNFSWDCYGIYTAFLLTCHHRQNILVVSALYSIVPLFLNNRILETSLTLITSPAIGAWAHVYANDNTFKNTIIPLSVSVR